MLGISYFFYINVKGFMPSTTVLLDDRTILHTFLNYKRLKIVIAPALNISILLHRTYEHVIYSWDMLKQ